MNLVRQTKVSKLGGETDLGRRNDLVESESDSGARCQFASVKSILQAETA